MRERKEKYKKYKDFFLLVFLFLILFITIGVLYCLKYQPGPFLYSRF